MADNDTKKADDVAKDKASRFPLLEILIGVIVIQAILLAAFAYAGHSPLSQSRDAPLYSPQQLVDTCVAVREDVVNVMELQRRRILQRARSLPGRRDDRAWCLVSNALDQVAKEIQDQIRGQTEARVKRLIIQSRADPVEKKILVTRPEGNASNYYRICPVPQCQGEIREYFED
jgi:hypothetical protein